MKISIVVPAHNEEANLKNMVSLLFKNFGRDIYEMIVIDDCSTDNTGKILDKLTKVFRNIVSFHRTRRGGVGNAIKKGLSLVSPKAEYVLMLDCDFTKNVSDIKKLINSLGDADGILGSRYMKGGRLVNYPLIKKIANRFFHLCVHLLLGIPHIDLTNNFKFYKREIIDDIQPLLVSRGFSINAETGLYPVLLGYKLKEIPVSWVGRTLKMGSSKFKVLQAGSGYFNILLKSFWYKLFGFPNNKISSEVIERIHFDNLISKTGETYYGNLQKIAKLRFKRKSKNIRGMLKVSNPRVLELGCGTALLSKDLLLDEKKIRIEGIDISPRAISVAKKNLRRYKNANFITGSALKLPYKSEYFDAVIGNSILHHLPLERTLNEVKRVLKPRGFIWLCEPNMLNPQIFIEKNIPIIKNLLQDSKGESAFYRFGLKRELEKHNFGNVNVVPYEFLHPFLPDFLISFAIKLEKVPFLREFAGTLKITAFKVGESK